MDDQLFIKLHAAGIISDSSLKKIKLKQDNNVLSVYWELKFFLYIGILLFTTGAGILVYKNIDSIGHIVILLFIALVSFGSFIYCLKQATGFSRLKVNSPNAYFDYVLILACLTFTSLIAYLQFQYQFFGFRYGLALFIPMIILFIAAYYFDNLAILSLAITNLGAWAGIAVTPLQILHSNNFNSATIIYTSLALGAFLALIGFISDKIKIKAHFEFSYSNIGAHLLFIFSLAAMITFDDFKFLWLLVLGLIGYLCYKKAVRKKSFYFLLMMTLYLYAGLSYFIFEVLFVHVSLDLLYLIFTYYIITACGLIIFLIKMNKKFKIL